MGMTHPAIVDDDNTGTTGTTWNNAWETSHDTAIDAAIAAVAPAFPGTSAPTTTGTSTALALPTGTGNLVLYLNNATLLTIQGIAAGLSGQLLMLVSKGAGQVDLAHLHASGTALGKLKLLATTGLTSLSAGSGVALLEYDATVTQWRLVSHDQGAWITPTFAGGDYTGDGTITWTVDSGDVNTAAYRLDGRMLTVTLYLVTTSTGGTASTQLKRAIPAGFTATKSVGGMCRVQDNGATRIAGMIFVLAAGTTITYSKVDFSNWSNASTNATEVFGTISFEVN